MSFGSVSTQLAFEILGYDKSGSKVIEGLGKELDKSADKFAGWQGKAAAASAAVVGALAAFGVTSVKAYADAEEKQRVLEDAYQRFPALADVSIDKLREQAAALQAKTGADGDAINSAQGLLAQFGLTGQQVEQLTPLMVDYASKTGKDLPTAAEDLGKALLGQGRSLKEVGIDFADAGSVGANFDQIVGGLRTQVGGFAEKEGQSAQGQLAIMRESFGDLQEAVGEQLMPALQRFADWAIRALGWMNEHKGLMIGLGAAVGVLAGSVLLVSTATTLWNTASTIARAATVAWTGVQWALNAAMSANPIGLIVIAIMALIAIVVLAWQHSETFRNIVTGAWEKVKAAIQAVADWWTQVAYPAISNAVQAVGDWFTRVGDTIGRVWQGIKDAIHLAWLWVYANVFIPIQVKILQAMAIWEGLKVKIAEVWDNVQAKLAAGWDWIQANVFDRIGAAIDTAKEAFRTGVDAIGQFWDRLKGYALTPVRFVIETVLNNGIIRAVNNVAEFFGQGRPIANLPVPAMGGAGPSGVATGGIADFVSGVASGVVDALTDPAGFLRGLANNLLGGLASNPFANIIRGAPGKVVDWAAQWIKSLIPAGQVGTAGRVLPAGSYSIGMPYLGYPGHYGADYPAPMGTPIFAPWAGVVSRAVSLATSYGKHVFLEHPGGIQTRYAHMQGFAVGAGQVVQPGQLLGWVDSTGNSTGSHLHFEYRRNGVPINPATLGLFDRGGWLPHGGLALNLSGQPERVLSPAESKDYGAAALRDALEGARLEIVGVGSLADAVSARIVLASSRRAGR